MLSGATVRKYLLELKRVCTAQCPDRCDGDAEHGHVGLVVVHQGGDGHTASYTMNVQAAQQAAQQAGNCSVESATARRMKGLVGQTKHAERPPVVLSSSSREASQHYSPVVGSSPAANNAAAAKPLPERQKPNPKPRSGGTPAFGAEVAEIREALKARPLVRLNPAFDLVIREMLASGETVETIKRAILEGCWLKLAGRDRAALMGVADTSLIFSMRYFADVIPAVKRQDRRAPILAPPGDPTSMRRAANPRARGIRTSRGGEALEPDRRAIEV